MAIFLVGTPTKLSPSLSFAGRAVLVTGGTTGLGLAAAIQFVQRGAFAVTITARSQARGLAAKAAIESATGTAGKNIVHVRELDMSTFAGIASFVDGLKAEVKEIDIVILNAGVFEFEFKTGVEGWEGDLMVNSLGTSLLALLMVEWMRSVTVEGKEQHLTIVGSQTHMSADTTADSFPKTEVLKFWNEKKNWDSRGQYGISKLLVQFASLEIAKIAAERDGVANPIISTVCPGPVRTELARGFGSKSFIHAAILKLLMARQLTPEQGAWALLEATTATSSENGKFFAPGLTDERYKTYLEQNITSEAGRTLQAQVWKEILEVLEEKVPEVRNIVRASERL